MRCFYHGCIGGAGHYLWDAGPHKCWSGGGLPFRASILDAGLLDPQREQAEGVVRRVVIAGWTVLAFWDRSIDSRPGSNSAFVVEGEHSTADALQVAKQNFPAVFERFRFALTEEI